jgi:hypothetical protein
MYGKQETFNTKYMITNGESNDNTSTSQWFLQQYSKLFK